MKLKAIRQIAFSPSGWGAALAMLCGFLLWLTPVGEPWVDASYDYLFRFGARAVTNRVTLILMDNKAFAQFHQTRGARWDRSLHAKLLNRLADDGCDLVVFDSFFQETNNPTKDNALAEAMRRQRHIVLMAKQDQIAHPALTGAEPELPAALFLNAARTNWGVAWLNPDSDWLVPDSDSVVRKHWPFPSPGPYPSLPWVTARLAGAKVSDQPQYRWLRYYGDGGGWNTLSYGFALNEPTNYFRGQTVFIGTEPENSMPGRGEDKFNTPYTRWTQEASGGVEILLTSFLNLTNGDWLERPPGWIEGLMLAVAGAALGGGLCRLRLARAGMVATAAAAAIGLGTISWSYYSNYWFPWLVIAGGQLPLACAWAVAVRLRGALEKKPVPVAISFPRPADAIVRLPETPGYELFNPPFGEGAYGRVWLARNTARQWRAVKAVYLDNFDQNPGPYEREFNGIRKYQPVSTRHPGLLRVEFVSEQLDGYFYYVMELGDALQPGWEENPSLYQPRDLGNERGRAPGRRLPIPECARIGSALCDALDFLHREGLTHRDIKPQNIIFVNGQPKLTDMGLVTEIRPAGQERTLVGTPGYMPPAPERPGTPQADIYALGMVLYVLSTGRPAALFPEIATTLIETRDPADFLPLNRVILKACQLDPAQRYSSAIEMRRALEEIGKSATPGAV